MATLGRQVLRAAPPPVPKVTALASWDSAARPPYRLSRGPCQPAGLPLSHSACRAKSHTVPEREKGSGRLPGQAPLGLPGAHPCPARPYRGRCHSTPLRSGGMAAPRGEGQCSRPCGDRARCTPRAAHDLSFSWAPWHAHGLAGTWRRRCRLAVTEPAFPARRHMTHVAEINIVTLILWEVFSQLQI